MDENIIEHPVLDDVCVVLKEVYDIEGQIEDMKQLLNAAKQRLYEAVIDLPEKIGDNEDLHNEIFHYLYWIEDHIPANILKQVFNMISSAEGTARHGQTKTKTGKGIIRPASFDVLCDTCNQPFEMLISNRGDLQDKQKYLNGKHRMTCKECYAKANARYHQAWQQAEAERQRRLDELHTMPYREYLQSPEWQVTRKRAMKRAGFRCQICNAYGVRLNVHHRTYERRGYEENQDLIVLCEGCHSIFHENGSLARY